MSKSSGQSPLSTTSSTMTRIVTSRPFDPRAYVILCVRLVIVLALTHARWLS